MQFHVGRHSGFLLDNTQPFVDEINITPGQRLYVTKSEAGKTRKQEGSFDLVICARGLKEDLDFER